MRLGTKACDKVSNFSGIVVARTERLYGCPRVGIQSTRLHEGKPLVQWFDEDQVQIVEKQATVNPWKDPDKKKRKKKAADRPVADQ